MPTAGSKPLPAAVLISGRGSNLQALIDRIATGKLPLEIRLVISDRPGVEGLARAQGVGIKTQVVAPAGSAPAAYGKALIDAIDAQGAELVILAGFMRILDGDFVRHYQGRLLNVHPSLLPKYRGLHTHRRALAAGERMHGCSVHFVSDELDGGSVIAQATVPVLPDDDEAVLRARVQQREHLLYPEVIGWFAAGRLRLQDGRAELDGLPLDKPKVLPWGATRVP